VSVSVYFENPRVEPAGCRGVFSETDYANVAAFFASRPEIRPTPLLRLPALAARLGLRQLSIKNESRRMGLDAFKGAGAAYAIDRLIVRGTAVRASDHTTDAVAAGSGPVTPILDASSRRLVCASAGNHGRAVAHVGRTRGLEVTVYMSAATAEGPRLAIEREGARVVLVDGAYDDAVRRAASDAATSGAVMVSDTAWPGYVDIPHDIMAGYTRIMDEARAQWDETPTLAIVQAGVGSLAAAAAAWWSDRFGAPAAVGADVAPTAHAAGVEQPGASGEFARRPWFVCCEPISADPLLQSARAGHLTTSTQPMHTIMSGLRCSEPSSLAVPILLRAADAFVAIDDTLTREAMRLLARPGGSDPVIVAGPSGAAGLGALLAICDRHPGARALLINTEGATDGPLYESIVR
jgi:diaminopropionate ammonia-lyase